MKKSILFICLCALGMAPAFGQGRHSIAEFLAGPKGAQDTVRAVLDGVKDPEIILFVLKDDSGKLKVQLGGKPKETADGFFAMDVRPGDTLTVAGKLTKKKKPGKKDPEMIDATILVHDLAVDHDDQSAYPPAMDQKPMFMGKDANAFSNWVNAHLVYPPGSRNQGSEGTVTLKFTIDQTGELTELEVAKSSGDPRLDSEAYRVVNSCPAWTPGSIKGKPVKVTYTFPVIFELRSSQKSGNHPSGWNTR